MRIVLQRVARASVTIEKNEHAAIDKGLLLLVGIEINDTIDDATVLANKIPALRIFGDNKGLMNLSNRDINGDYLVISQFTLHADTKKGNRPSYIKSARPEQAIPIYEKFIDLLGTISGKEIKTGIFGADMKVELINDGPVTILLDSKS